MNLSKAQAALAGRRSGSECAEQVRLDGLHVEAMVEAELELGEVAVSALGEVEGVVSAGDGRLQVAQQGVNPDISR
jgi:hypothetical protein